MQLFPNQSQEVKGTVTLPSLVFHGLTIEKTAKGNGKEFFIFIFHEENRCCSKDILMLGLDVLLDDVMSWTLLAPVANDDRGASDDLPGLALGVELAKTGPLAQLLVVVNLDEGNLKVKTFLNGWNFQKHLLNQSFHRRG
jgi:hypothetical protein